MATSKRARRLPAAPRAPAPPPTEAALYAPDPDAVTVDGRRFRIGKMRIGPSLRFTELAVRLIARGEQAIRATMTLEDPAARAAAVRGLNVLTILPEDDLAELVAIALSQEDAIDRAWVKEHWDLEWVLPLLARWTDLNPLGAYFTPLGKVLLNLNAQMAAAQAKPPTPTA